MNFRHRIALLATTSLVAACTSEPVDSLPADTVGLDRGASGLLATELAFEVAAVLGDLETLEASSSAESVAANFHGIATGLVGTCGEVTRDGTTVSVTIMEEGCVLPPPVDPEMPVEWIPPAGTTAGTATFTVSRSEPEVVIAVTLDGIVTHGVTLAGSATLSTADAATWSMTVDLDVTNGETAHVTGDLVIDFSPSSRELEGPLAVERAGVTTSATLVRVAWDRADCYPRSGFLTWNDAEDRETTATFAPTTASSGGAAITLDGTDTDATLPAYGDCPTS